MRVIDEASWGFFDPLTPTIPRIETYRFMVLATASSKEVGGGREAAPAVFYPDRPSLTAFPGGASPTSEDLEKKTRKPYTISKSRESWTDQDHDKFLEALQL